MEAKKIIITGGATRIGAAIAKSLVNYETKMVIHFNKSKSNALKLKKELEELGAETFLLKADLNNFKQTNSLIKNAYTKMRGLDCLINNASVFENDNLENFSEKSFSKHININLKAPAILTQNFNKLMKNKEGCIVNIIDQRVEKLTPFFFSYTLSKSSLAILTKTSAMKLAPNIRVNGISPGPTLKNKRQSERHFKKQWKSIILRKKVDLENICNGVKFLIESKSITGEIIIKDLTLNILVGIHNFEKKKKQRVKFNIEIMTDPYVSPNSKNLNSILNYEEVVIKIEKLAGSKHHELLEDLAENIFKIIFKNKLVKKINLKLEKLDILKKTKSVGIEVSKTKT